MRSPSDPQRPKTPPPSFSAANPTALVNHLILHEAVVRRHLDAAPVVLQQKHDVKSERHRVLGWPLVGHLRARGTSAPRISVRHDGGWREGMAETRVGVGMEPGGKKTG